MKTLEEYKELLLIDKLQLDRGIEEQAVYFNEVAQICSEAVSIRDGAKTEMDKVYAEQSIQLRKYWDETVNGKLTESNLHQHVISGRNYIRVQGVWLQAKAVAEQWLGMKESWSQRGFMLRLETELYVAGYFAEFTTKGESINEVQVTQLRQRLTERRNRND